MKTDERLSPSVITAIHSDIVEASGNEIFIIGSCDVDGIVAEVKTVARGDSGSVPALRSYSEKGDVVMHNHPSGNLSPSENDLNIASRLGDHGIGFYIIDNDVENIYVVAEPVLLKEKVPLDAEELASIISPDGELEKKSDFYEERPNQIEMLKLVCRSFNEDFILIAEAGTGIGKSLAYLIPAVKWISKNDERVVVSTGTINLQQQLLEKDIPLVMKLLGVRVKAVLVKGRGNYVCLYRLYDALEDKTLFEEDDEQVRTIYEWAKTSETGSKSDLAFLPSASAWSRVCSETDLCMGLYCRHREKCFVLKARKEAAAGKLLVVNHHLLFSDLSMRLSGMGHEATAVLPPFQRVVFDEAHNIESSATSFFSESFSLFTVMKYLGRLLKKRKGRRYGLIVKLEKEAHDKKPFARLPALVDAVSDKAKILNEMALSLMERESSFHLVEDENPYIRDHFFDPLLELETDILKLVHVFSEIFGQFDDVGYDSSDLYECRMQVRRLKNIAETCDQFKFIKKNRDKIFWLQREKSYSGVKYVIYTITPLEIGELLNNALYKPYESIIFTSATLTVNKSFGYWKSRLGIKSEIVEASFDSPFNYREQVFLGVPVSAPEPDREEFMEFLSPFLREAILLSEGRALVLFTSYVMLNRVYGEIYDDLNGHGIHIFKQGEDDRARLLTRFKEDVGSVLFATDSFWEGVDSPGETLELLVLCKLPFRVPSEPVTKARMEAIRERGGNPFMEFLLPEACIKLKQGFGRLMRRKSDKGLVLILDSRLVRKSYGSHFLNSLPITYRCLKDQKYLFDEMEQFIVNMRKNSVKA
ncbi:MAG: DEAD/DEAH box helicase [Spirochaetales bacterium]|nr:DEAD/DEAH box helicase [Spirochaetales bacterium]